MSQNRYSPEPSRVSVLMAAVLLAFGVTRVLNGPSYPLDLRLGGLDLSFTVNLNSLIILLAAGLTATGMDWLLRTHPSLEKGETREHWLLPTVTVLVIGITLSTLPPTAVWWLGFALGAVILLVVFLAEYVVVDPSDLRYPIAASLLSVLAFVIFLILAVALKAASARLIVLAPALFLGAGLGDRDRHRHCPIGLGPALPAADAGALRSAAARPSLCPDGLGRRPAGKAAFPTRPGGAGCDAGIVLGVFHLVSLVPSPPTAAATFSQHPG
jgi:hypothetical protein